MINSSENNPFYSDGPNIKYFQKTFCEVFLIQKSLFKETEPKKISKYINLIGFNFVHYNEFVSSIVWYMYNLSLKGEEDDILDAIKYLRDILKFYPRTPYLYFILKKIYEYLLKNQFYNYESDFLYFLDLMDKILTEFTLFFNANKLALLKKYQAKLNISKDQYIVNKLIDNIEDQLILSLNNAQIILNDDKTHESIKVFCLVILIYNFKQLNIKPLEMKYTELLKKQISEKIDI